MKTSLKRALLLTPIFALLTLHFLYAEVKLRVYLKDGSLKAGNLVGESEKSFVILARSGREEIPKSDIMFINGKTLKQWDDRPDRMFSTEIMPDEIPKPGYVNDMAQMEKATKAKQPTVPEPVDLVAAKAKQEKQTQATSQASNAVPEVPLVLMNQQNAAPVKPVAQKPPLKKAAPVVKQEAAQAKPKAVVAKKSRKKTKSVIAKKKKRRAKAALAKKKKQPKPQRYSRKKSANFHYENGLAFLEKGDVGRAKQELHYATVLDRRNSDAALILGRLYKKEGVFDRAETFFSHPGLKKNREAKKSIEEMGTAREESQKANYVLLGSTAGGFLTMIPLLYFVRRFGKKPRRTQREKKVVVDAEKLVVDVLEKPAIKEEKEPVKEMVPPPTPAERMEKAFTNLQKPPEKKPEPQKPVPPKPPELKPIELKPILPKPIEPKPEPVAQPVAQKPPVKREPIPIENIIPAEDPYSEEERRRIQFEVQRMLEEILQRGHHYVYENDLDKANREYRTALTLDRSSVEAQLGIGYVCFMQKHYDLALESYLRVLKFEPQNADAHYGLGRILLENDHVEEAIEEFQKTLHIDPTFEAAQDTLTNLGMAVEPIKKAS